MSIIAGSKYGGHNNGSEPAMTRVSETGWLTTGVRGWEMRPPRPSALMLAHWLLSLREMQHGVTQQHAPRAGTMLVIIFSPPFALSLFYFYYSFPFLLPLPPLLSHTPLVLCRLLPLSSLPFSRSSSLCFSPWSLRLVLLRYRRSCTTVPINDLPDVPPI